MVDQNTFNQYRDRNVERIKGMLADMGCRPVLFVGSGLTRRYLGGPSWNDLLLAISGIIGMDSAEFAFLSQKANNDPAELGTLLADRVHEWAFGTGKNAFPAELFEPGRSRDNFIKHLCAEIIRDLSPNLDHLNGDLAEEVKTLREVSPHAIITTNYDLLLESLFPDYERVIGERIIPFSLNIFGELYKIHGTVEEPSSIVLTGRDYERYSHKRKYISSKMMTYFAEFPVFIFGYSLSDRNVNAIISDLGEALKEKGGLLENVFYVQRVRDISQLGSLQEEYAIPSADHSSPPLRVRTIVTPDFDWIFKALADTANPVPIPTKTLRHLAARVVELVRVDVPKNQIEVNIDQVKRLSEDPRELASVLGIGNIQNPNINYPYSITDLSRRLGYNHWHRTNELLKAASEKLDYDIKASDNEYHMKFRAGQRTEFHKYSEAAFELLERVREEQRAALAAAALFVGA